MQDEMQFSLLVWEDVNNLPLPDEIRGITKDVKWDAFEWHAIGLPLSQAKFTMGGGKTLYLSELPNGEVKVQQLQDFTGRIAFSGYFVDEEGVGGFNYFITMIATIVKGEVIEVEVNNFQKQPIEEYKHAMQDFQVHVNRVLRMSNSWWFKWLYRPWFFVVRGLGFMIFCVLKFFRDCVLWVVKKLTPF